MLITIAIPCYRSENNIRAVVDEIKEVFAGKENYDYQVILVNDGSPDRTDEVIREICSGDERVTGILLSRNYSQVNAKMAAVPYVKGDVLVYMDDDGQHPADDIFKLVDKVREGNDLVYACFKTKKQSLFKIWTSNVFGWLSVKFGKRPKGIKTSSFSAFSSFAIEALKGYSSPSPDIGGFLYSITTKIANVESVQRQRKSGRSGYNLGRLISLAVTSLTNFTVVPLRIMDAIGTVFACIGMLYGLVLIIRRLFFGNMVAGYTSNMVVMLILGGFILVGLGLVGEYVGRVYMILSNKPQYMIREIVGSEKKKDEG